MEEPGKRWQSLTMLSARDSEILLRSGVAPGRLGAPKGAPLFLASSRPRAELREEAAARRSRDADECSEEADDFVRQPMFMLDAERRIKLRNASGAELLARSDLLTEHRGTLACRDPDSERRLGLAIGKLGIVAAGADIAFAPERQAVWLRRRDNGGAVATLHLLHSDASAGERFHARVLVTVFEPGEAPSVDPRVIAMAYGLTGAEARLASLIASGKDTAYCARELGVKTSTLRSHLSAIYQKTGARGQADLVRMVLSLCAM